MHCSSSKVTRARKFVYVGLSDTIFRWQNFRELIPIYRAISNKQFNFEFFTVARKLRLQRVDTLSSKTRGSKNIKLKHSRFDVEYLFLFKSAS